MDIMECCISYEEAHRPFGTCDVCTCFASANFYHIMENQISACITTFWAKIYTQIGLKFTSAGVLSLDFSIFDLYREK